MNPQQASLPSLAVELEDGSIAELRPVRSIDRDLIEEGLAGMSVTSRLARFGAAVDHLTESELDYLTDTDLVDHVAWGATIGGAPAASGRYIRPEGASEAEMAVAVVDRFQRLGLGRALFQALVASARHNGVDRLYFSVQPGNSVVLDILAGVETHLNEEQGLMIGHLEVAAMEPGSDDDRIVDLLEWYQSSV